MGRKERRKFEREFGLNKQKEPKNTLDSILTEEQQFLIDNFVDRPVMINTRSNKLKRKWANSKVSLTSENGNSILCCVYNSKHRNKVVFMTKFKLDKEDFKLFDHIEIKDIDKARNVIKDNYICFDYNKFLIPEGILTLKDVSMFNDDHTVKYSDISVLFNEINNTFGIDIYGKDVETDRIVNIGSIGTDYSACTIMDFMNELAILDIDSKDLYKKFILKIEDKTRVMINYNLLKIGHANKGILINNNGVEYAFMKILFNALLSIDYVYYLLLNRKTIIKSRKSSASNTVDKNKDSNNTKEDNSIVLTEDVVIYASSSESKSILSNKIRKKCDYSYIVSGHWRHYKNGKKTFIKSYVKNKGKEFKSKTYTTE